jgi:hypothetical protein
MLFALPAMAQRVVLVPPETKDPVLSDAFNRLKAELNIHDFEIEVRGVALGPDPTDALTRVAQESDAFASIALLKREDQALVQIWLVDRVSGKATMRALQVEPGTDAANLLAIRAVDLLRASLREFNPNEKPPTDVVNVDRRATPVVVQKLAERPPSMFSLRADALFVYQWPHFGMSVGPAIGGALRLGRSAELDVIAAGPVVGAKYDTSEGSSSLRQELAWLEPRWQIVRSRRVALGTGLVAGVLLLHAQGQPNAPLVAQSANLYGFLGGLSLHTQAELAPGVSCELAVKALGTAPRLGVMLDTQRTSMAFPMLVTTLGIRVAL